MRGTPAGAARYAVFQMAEVAVPKELFKKILCLVDRLRPRPAPGQGREGRRRHHYGEVRLNDGEKCHIDEPDVALDIATAEASAKPPAPPFAFGKTGRMLAFAPFQGVIRRMSA